MKKVRLWLLVFLCMMAVFQVLLTEELLESAHRRNCFSYETAFRNLRNHNLTKDQVNTFFNNAGSDMEGFCELLTMYFASDCQMTDPKLLKKQVADAKKYRGNEFTEINGYVKSVWSDLLCFPVGKIAGKPEDNVVFENSWMQSRTFGGDRGHEGTDIMASENVRGIYPVYSMTDGVVENIGWLRLGGYRIGIRPVHIFIMPIWRSMQKTFRSVKQYRRAHFSALWVTPVTAMWRARPGILQSIFIWESI